MRIFGRRRRSPWKDVAAGAIGGLAGTAAMSAFQALGSMGKPSSNGQQQPADEPATVKAAEAVIQGVFRRSLPESKKGIAGNITHYAFGTLSGAVYGAVRHKLRFADASRGALFGVGLWVLADEVMVPALKLSKPVTESPLSTHLYGLASHLVYAAAADATANLTRRLL